MLMLLQALPPDPTELDTSKLSPSQPPTTDGIDSTTVGTIGLAGLLTLTDDALENFHAPHPDTALAGHAAFTNPLLIFTTSPTDNGLLAWFANISTDTLLSHTHSTSPHPLHWSSREQLNPELVSMSYVVIAA